MLEDAKVAIAKSSLNSSVYIGCDSIVKTGGKKGVAIARYCVVVVLHHDSCHGGSVYHEMFTENDYGNLYHRLITEVNYAVQAANEISPVLGGRKV